MMLNWLKRLRVVVEDMARQYSPGSAMVPSANFVYLSEPQNVKTKIS